MGGASSRNGWRDISSRNPQVLATQKRRQLEKAQTGLWGTRAQCQDHKRPEKRPHNGLTSLLGRGRRRLPAPASRLSLEYSPPRRKTGN